MILYPPPAWRDLSVPPQGLRATLGANNAFTSTDTFQGIEHRTGHTQPGTPPQEGAPKAESLIAKSWKGPDAPERGGRAASHNGKATDYLNSNPCPPAALEGPQSQAGRTLRGHPGQSVEDRGGSRERQGGRGQAGTEGV